MAGIKKEFPSMTATPPAYDPSLQEITVYAYLIGP